MPGSQIEEEKGPHETSPLSFWLVVFAQDKIVKANESTGALRGSSFADVFPEIHPKPRRMPTFSDGLPASTMLPECTELHGCARDGRTGLPHPPGHCFFPIGAIQLTSHGQGLTCLSFRCYLSCVSVSFH